MERNSTTSSNQQRSKTQKIWNTATETWDEVEVDWDNFTSEDFSAGNVTKNGVPDSVNITRN